MQALGSGIAHLLLHLWRIVRWPLAILAVLYILTVIYYLFELPKESKATVEAIHAQKLTMKDVDGTNLPPAPDPKQVDATVEGIDANQNGIRDDVELAIYKKYPSNIKLRAAALQYAMTEQWFLSPKIQDKATWKAAAEQDGRASSCIAQQNLSYGATMSLTEYIESSVTNTKERKQRYDSAFSNTTSYGDGPRPFCDVEF